VSVAPGAVEWLYSEVLEQHGASPLSVGWKDAVSQRLRFAKLAQLLPAGAEPMSVNDLGCGYGSLFSYLDELTGVKLERYDGYDISEPMLDHARQATDERAELIHGSEPAHVADWSFASGPFNVKGESSDAAWEAYVQDRVQRLAQSSQREISPYVTLVHDYPLYEWTMLVRHP